MEKIRVGALFNTHGLKGEVKIKSFSDFNEERFQVGTTLWIKYKLDYIEVVVKSYREANDCVLVVFEEYEDINKIEQYKGCEVFINRSDIHNLSDGYYFFDLLGCEVFDQDNNRLGEVEDVMETGANALIRVNKTVLIPVVPAFVVKVDIKEKKIVVNVIEGLI